MPGSTSGKVTCQKVLPAGRRRGPGPPPRARGSRLCRRAFTVTTTKLMQNMMCAITIVQKPSRRPDPPEALDEDRQQARAQHDLGGGHRQEDQQVASAPRPGTGAAPGRTRSSCRAPSRPPWRSAPTCSDGDQRLAHAGRRRTGPASAPASGCPRVPDDVRLLVVVEREDERVGDRQEEVGRSTARSAGDAMREVGSGRAS